MMSKVTNFARSKGLIVINLAATNLAALEHEDCSTGYSGQGYPVVEDGDVIDTME